ncbi:MAG: hypothetical protein ABI995_06390, partial [Acidobacteriota bacterium]
MNRLFLTTVVLFSVPLLGQQVLDPLSGRTVEDLVVLALKSNGDLLGGQQQVLAARGGVTQARLKANPSIQFSDSQEAAGSQNSFMI